MHPAGSPSPQEVQALIALFNGGQLPEAAARAQAMTRQFPHHPFGWKLLGAALKELGRDADSLAPMQRAAALAPKNAEALSNLSVTLRDLGRLDEALACARKALEIRADRPALHLNLANALMDLGQLDDAMAAYHRAVELGPDQVIAYTNWGSALTRLGRFHEAEAILRRALTVNPHYFATYINLGIVLHDLGRVDEAVASYRRALELKPDSPEAHTSLGAALSDLGQFDAACAILHRAIELKPDHAFAHNNLGNCCKEAGRIDDAIESYRRAVEFKPDCFVAFDNLLFAQLYQARPIADAAFVEARRFGEVVARTARPYTDWINPPDPDRRLRVGLVSGDFGNHPVGYFIEGVLSVFAADSHRRLEFFGYSSHPRSGDVAERIKACCHGWYSAAGLTDESLARRIREDRIDILIDLSGHTAHNRLPMFAWKPAPVQISWLGYLATTGVAAIDYVVGDPWTLPESEAPNFTEKIWHLPETYVCFAPPGAEPGVLGPPAFTTRKITFGSFNYLAKMNDEVVAIWARILSALPQSRLFLKTPQLAQAAARAQVLQRFAAHGIDEARLILEGRSPRAELLSSYGRVDIALDPFPYPGITTTLEALWMGVPVLTISGRSFLSRQGVGLLMNAGLPEWIAADTDDYVAKAVAYARDLENLRKLRRGMRQTLLTSSLIDAQRFAGNFQAALYGMWTQWCSGQNRKASRPPRGNTGAPART